LIKNDGIFNYATDYYKTLIWGIKPNSNADYQDFKQYLKAQNISFDTETELALKNTLWWPRKKKIDATIITEYQQLLAALQKSEETLLDKNQEEIRNLN
jgi:carboxyl-terminal processing protease